MLNRPKEAAGEIAKTEPGRELEPIVAWMQGSTPPKPTSGAAKIGTRGPKGLEPALIFRPDATTVR